MGAFLRMRQMYQAMHQSWQVRLQELTNRHTPLEGSTVSRQMNSQIPPAKPVAWDWERLKGAHETVNCPWRLTSMS